MSVIEIVNAILCFVFIAVLIKACLRLKLSVIPAVLAITMPVSMLCAGLFPMGHQLHTVLGPIVLLTILGTGLSVLLWGKGYQLKTFRVSAMISFLLMLLILLRFLPSLQNYPGLIQRFYYTGFTIWFISISINFSKLLRQKSAFIKTNNFVTI